MITQDDLKNWQTNDYIDKIVLHSIAMLSSLTLKETKDFNLIIKTYSAELLSETSYMRTYIEFVMDNLSTLQQDLYLPEIIDNNASVRNTTFNALSIANLQLIISKVAASLTEIKGMIEKSYDLPENSLSIYTDQNIEQGINFVNEKATSSIALKYYEGKVLLRNTVSLFENFSTAKNYYDDTDFSGQYSFIDKLNYLLDTSSSVMQNKLLINSVTEELIDSALAVFCSYEEYSFPDKQSVDLFLSQKYSKIKEDIITALKNHI